MKLRLLNSALRVSALFASVIFTVACQKKQAPVEQTQPVLRVGFFPNITHVQGLIGYNETQTKGAEAWFEKATGAKIEWYHYNAGPSAIEAMLADSIDVTYVGPSPVMNGYTRTKTADIRVLAGAARGGSALVVQPELGIKTAADFRGRKLATPQFGNTQDVSARAWLQAGGLNLKANGGEVFVIPTQNPDQLELFKRKQLDGVWTVEPWVSRLEIEANGQVLVEDREGLVTVLATHNKALQTKRELIRKFVAAHAQLTAKIQAEPEWAKPLVSAALVKVTTKPISPPVLERAWPRLTLTTSVSKEDFAGFQKNAKDVGLISSEVALDPLIVTP